MTPQEPMLTRDTCEEDRETILRRLAEFEPEGPAARLLTVRALLAQRDDPRQALRPLLHPPEDTALGAETTELEPNLLQAMNRVDQSLESFRRGAGAQVVCHVPRPTPLLPPRSYPAHFDPSRSHEVAIPWIWVMLLTAVTAASAAIMVARIAWL